MTTGDARPRRKIVVVGGGVSGLAAAHSLAEAFDVTLLEARTSTGGLIRTTEFRGRPLDAAADVFITRTPDAEKLASDLGLGDALVVPATSEASVFARGAVRPLPAGLVLGVPTDLRALWASRVVSARSVMRAMVDLLDVGAARPAAFRSRDADPTIAEVFEPRLGREIFATLIDPLLGGINAGDARALSYSAAVPMLAEATAGKASIIRALRPLARRRPGTADSPLFLGFADGMATLTDRLANECVSRGVRIRSSVSAREVHATEGGPIRLKTSSDTITADGALIALPAWATAPIIRSMSALLADELEAIPYASVATIALAYAPEGTTARAQLSGSGVLIPRDHAYSTALTFVSNKWPRASGDREFIIRASVGRHGDERARELDDGELIQRVHAEIATMLGIDAGPFAAHVERFADAFPQYVSGHLERRRRISRLTDALGPVVITGSWSGGVGIPACIASARDAARQLTDRLR